MLFRQMAIGVVLLALIATGCSESPTAPDGVADIPVVQFMEAEWRHIPVAKCRPDAPMQRGEPLFPIEIMENPWPWGYQLRDPKDPRAPYPMVEQKDGSWLAKVKTPVGIPQPGQQWWPDRPKKYGVSVFDPCRPAGTEVTGQVLLNGVNLTDRRWLPRAGDQAVMFTLNPDGSVTP